MLAPRKLTVLVLASLAALLAAALVAGCGGGSSGSSGGEPASIMPADAPLYFEANLAPEAKEGEALNELASTVFGVSDVGEFVTEKLERSWLGDGVKVNFEEEVEPWLGERFGLYLSEFEGKGNGFGGEGLAFSVTDAGEAEEFFAKHNEEARKPPEEGEFEGVKYWVSKEDGSVFGLIGDYLALGKDKADFETMVKTEEAGNGLSEAPAFKKAIEAAPENGVGHVFVDIGGLIEQAKGQISGEAEAMFGLLQIEPQKATVVGTLIPHSEQVELDVSTDLGKSTLPAGDASKLLESLPATAVLGFASSEFGKSFAEGVHGFSESGVPGQLEPGELEAALETLGINLESLGESFGDAGGFVEGTSRNNIGGALVVETSDPTEARSLITKIGLLLHGTGTEGVTAIHGPVSGFSVHNSKLGPRPLLVGTAGSKLVIAYGPRAAAQALRGGAQTLGSEPGFQAAKSALGSTPISLYIDGGPGLKLAEGLLSPEEVAELAGARPYLEKIEYVAVGSEAKGGTQTAKVLVGLGR